MQGTNVFTHHIYDFFFFGSHHPPLVFLKSILNKNTESRGKKVETENIFGYNKCNHRMLGYKTKTI